MVTPREWQRYLAHLGIQSADSDVNQRANPLPDPVI
jgi:hypothetical protein